MMVVLLSAAFASEASLGYYVLGWSAIILGTWIAFDGRHNDPLLLVDTAHAFLTWHTFGGAAGLTDHNLMLLHAAYHLALVTLAAFLIGPKKWFGMFIPCLYTAASYLMILVHRAICVLDPSKEAIALKIALDAADLLTTPYHWCLYNLFGGNKYAITLPIVAYTAYKSACAMYAYPTSAGPATMALLNSSEVIDAPLYMKVLIAFVPLFNGCILYPVVWPRIKAAYTHAKGLLLG